VSGAVVRPADGDSVPVPDVRVVLHRVAEAAQGPVDSIHTGADGRFRFQLVRDTAALYLLSARFHGIEYFSMPLDRAPEPGGEAVTLVVYDTSSSAPVAVTARHVVIPRPGDDGTREVLDLVLLANTGHRTRVAPDSLGASWSGPLPPRSEGLELGESDVSPDAVTRRGDSVIVSAPISPGEKQLAFQYHLPAGGRDVEIPVGSDPVTLNVLLEEAGGTVAGPGLEATDSQMIEGRSFRRWSGDVPARAVVRVTLPGAAGATPILAVLVGLLALSLLVAAWRMLAGTRRISSNRILDEIASLDARYVGKEKETPPDEWARYIDRRAVLKAELAAALARGSGGR
jgi:5-hydroxyisourate hydrolase-like protein (transthyretin family)